MMSEYSENESIGMFRDSVMYQGFDSAQVCR